MILESSKKNILIIIISIILSLMILNIYKNSNKNSSKIFTEIQDRAFVISWNILEKNLDKIIKSDFDINQIILNSKEFPYLDNILNATFENKNNSDFYVFYYVSFEIKDKDNNAYNEIIKSIKNFDILLSEKFKKLNKRKNIFFIDKNNTIDTTLREYFKRYETGNFNKFRKIINNLYYSGHDNINKESLIAFRIDFLKIMGVLYVFNIGYKSAIIIDPDIFPRFDDILIEDFYENKEIFFRFCNFYRHNKEIKRKYDINHQDIDLSEMIKKKKLIQISTCISESLIGLKNEDFIKKILLRLIDPINNYIGIGWQIYCLRNKAILSEETKEISDIVKYFKKKKYKDLMNDMRFDKKSIINLDILETLKILSDDEISDIFKNNKVSIYINDFIIELDKILNYLNLYQIINFISNDNLKNDFYKNFSLEIHNALKEFFLNCIIQLEYFGIYNQNYTENQIIPSLLMKFCKKKEIDIKKDFYEEYNAQDIYKKIQNYKNFLQKEKPNNLLIKEIFYIKMLNKKESIINKNKELYFLSKLKIKKNFDFQEFIQNYGTTWE